MTDEKQLISDLFKYLNSVVHLSRYQLAGVMAGILSGETMLLIGEPGSGKTYTCEHIASFLKGKSRYFLCEENMITSDLIGVYNFNEYKDGKPKRVLTNMMLDNKYAVVILDEIYRLNPATRNALLDILLYKRYYNYDEEIKVKTRIIGATNFVDTAEEMKAFNDRMVIKVFFANEPLGSYETKKEFLERALLKAQTNITLPFSYSLNDLENIEENIEQEAISFEKRYAKLISHIILSEIIPLYGLNETGRFLSIRMCRKMIKVAVTLRKIVDALTGRPFSYNIPTGTFLTDKVQQTKIRELIKEYQNLGLLQQISPTDALCVRDMLYAASLYVVPYRVETLFFENIKGTTRFEYVVRSTPSIIAIPSPDSIKERTQLPNVVEGILKMIDRLSSGEIVEEDNTICNWINPYLSGSAEDYAEKAAEVLLRSDLAKKGVNLNSLASYIIQYGRTSVEKEKEKIRKDISTELIR